MPLLKCEEVKHTFLTTFHSPEPAIACVAPTVWQYFSVRNARTCTIRLGGSEQKKKGGTQRRFTPYCQVCLSTTVQMAIKFAAHLATSSRTSSQRLAQTDRWPVIHRLPTQSSSHWGFVKIIALFFFLSLAKLCRLKFTFTEQEK